MRQRCETESTPRSDRKVGRRRVLLRADASRATGFGHFVRTTALAAYLREDFDCYIASYNRDGGVMSKFQADMLAESGAQMLTVTAEGDKIEDFDRAFLEKVERGDIVVLDNYYFTTEYQRSVRERSGCLVCIDDMHDRHFVADVVMTFCELPRELFSLERYTRFYGGIRQSFLRAPFLLPRTERGVYREPQRIVIAMGGADPLGLTDAMIRHVNRARPEAEISVIAGATVRVSDRPGLPVRVWRNIDARGVAELFDNSDLGIFPASTVCVEAFARRLPVAAGWFVDNQEEFYAHGVSEGWFAPLGDLRDPDGRLSERVAEAIATGPGRSPEVDFESCRREIVGMFRGLRDRG